MAFASVVDLYSQQQRFGAGFVDTGEVAGAILWRRENSKSPKLLCHSMELKTETG